MLFRRRVKEPLSKRVLVALWPRRTFWRSIKYVMLRVLRLTATPHVIAMGVAAGCFASFTPYLGCHFAISFAICFFTRGSYFAAAAGTFFGNPLTFPFIWASTLAAGHFVLEQFGGAALAAPEVPELSFDLIVNSFSTVWPVIKTMTIGAFPVGIPVAVVCYLIVREMAKAYKHSRLKMLADKQKELWAAQIEKELAEEDRLEAELEGPGDRNR
ncbi:MAG: DUF2062 domain-containing protein [Pseudomonadota bacterium]